MEFRDLFKGGMVISLGLCSAVTSCTVVQRALAAPPTVQVDAAVKTSTPIKAVRESVREQTDRNVDEAAIAAQDIAISKLRTLAKKYRGAQQEPHFLSRLGDIQSLKSALLFRIAHGRAHRSQGVIQLGAYKKSLQETVSTLTLLIKKYPHDGEIPHAYFLRAKANQEIPSKKDAIRDFTFLVEHYPSSEEIIPAYMALAEFAIEASDHPRAIKYLIEVEKRPDTPHYPFALHKLAWSNYNLKQIPESLSYVERQIRHYDELGAANTDRDLRENTLLDATLFFLEGFEQKDARFTLAHVLPWFRNLDKGQILGRVSLRFAKLLRSHGHEADLIYWKNKNVSEEADRPETLEIVTLTYENQFNRRRYSQLPDTLRDLGTLYKQHPEFLNFPAARKQILDSAESLQALAVKNKAADGVGELTSTLALIYDAFTRIVEESDPRIPKVHYNLAETLFEIRDYEQATSHYRWIVNRGSWREKRSDGGSIRDASLKSIASRYEVLKKSKLIPTEVRPVAFTGNPVGSVDPDFAEWLGWIDAHESKADKIAGFHFEAARALYTQGFVAESLERLTELAEAKPSTPFSPPAASLVLDTFILNQDWAKTQEIARSFLKRRTQWESSFIVKLETAAADSAFKITENLHLAHDDGAALKGAEKFIRNYPLSARVPDALLLGAHTSKNIGDSEKAEDMLSRLISMSGTTSAQLRRALLFRGELREQSYALFEASADYLALFEVDPGKATEEKAHPIALQSDLLALRKKSLLLAWITGNHSGLEKSIQARGSVTSRICGDGLQSECERYRALLALNSAETAKTQSAYAFDEARKSTGVVRTLWAAVALENSKHLAFRDRNLSVKMLAGGWHELDPLIQFALVPRIQHSITHAFALNRAALKEVAPLKAHERWIGRRIEVIREIENAASPALQLPWAALQVSLLSEISGVYLDLTRELESLGLPRELNEEERLVMASEIKKLTRPLEEKGLALLSKSFELASRTAVDEATFLSVSEKFTTANPSQARARQSVQIPATAMDLDLKFIEAITGEKAWDLKPRWARAVEARQFALAAFYLQVAREKKSLSAQTLGLTQAILLTQVGARAEALATLENALPDFEPKVRVRVRLLLLSNYTKSLAKEKAAQILGDLLNDYRAEPALTSTAGFSPKVGADSGDTAFSRRLD